MSRIRAFGLTGSMHGFWPRRLCALTACNVVGILTALTRYNQRNTTHWNVTNAIGRTTVRAPFDYLALCVRSSLNSPQLTIRTLNNLTNNNSTCIAQYNDRHFTTFNKQLTKLPKNVTNQVATIEP